MKLEDSIAYTARCFRGEPASCSYACPFRLDVRSLVDKMSKGRWNAAYKALRDATVFPGLVSILCDQPCRQHCQRTLLGDDAIALRDLEAACLRYAKDRKPQSYFIPPKQQCVAVVGAGTAGLSCALDLAQKQYGVTVFEREAGWGGSLRSHPRFAEIDVDLSLQLSAVNIEFRFGASVASLDELEAFDAVYVATGAGGEAFGLLGSWGDDLFTTSNPRVFLGGALTGAGLMEGIAQGLEASKILEVFLQTGKAARTWPAEDAKGKCDRYLEHRGATSVPLLKPSGPDGYTEAEAREEATRCLLCNCDNCIAGCEMLDRFHKDPHKIAHEVFTDMNVNPPFSVRTVTREVYSCNICGYCKSVCPEQVDVGALLQLSRAARQSAGIHAAALHDFWLREMDFATSEGALAAAPAGRRTSEYAFYPGCQLGAANPTHVLKSYEFLAASRDTGVILGCCGAPAYWAGDDERLRANIERTRQTWQALGRPTLIFACATCESLFSLFTPEIPRVSLYELLAASDSLAPAGLFAEAAVFDPCAARHDEPMERGVRQLARKAGVALEELDRRNRCCGYGGHIRVANPGLYEEVTQHRAEASDKPYLVYCANCREVFASRGKECAHVLDLAFGLPADARVPSLEHKRDNSLRVKSELMKQTLGVDFQPEPRPWEGVTLVIGAELQESLDRKLISAADLREAIWLAESSADKFCDEETGTSLCSMIRPVLTYWVEYRAVAPHTYEVVSAYTHRMRFRERTQ